MMSLHHVITSPVLLALLLACVTARSLKDDTLSDLAKPADVERGELAGPPEGRALADLVDFLLEYRRLMTQPQAEQQYFHKREWAEDGLVAPSGTKRKMFWSPLGQLPASARMSGRPQALRPTGMEESGSPVFRYG